MIYGSGLRISEATAIRVEDIDSKNMRLYVRNGKGERERYSVLPKASLEMLRKCYQMYQPKHPKGYMFLNREGNPLKPERLRAISTGDRNNVVYQSISKGQDDPGKNRFTTAFNLINNTVLYTLEWDGYNYNNTLAYTNSVSAEMLSELGTYSNDNASSVTIGRRFYGVWNPWYLKGKIFSIRVYNRKLTEQEIKNNYDVDKLRFEIE